VMNEAALEAVRRGGEVVTSADVYNGMDRILQARSPCSPRPQPLQGLRSSRFRLRYPAMFVIKHCIELRNQGSWCG
jgi:hypothetical protein